MFEIRYNVKKTKRRKRPKTIVYFVLVIFVLSGHIHLLNWCDSYLRMHNSINFYRFHIKLLDHFCLGPLFWFICANISWNLVPWVSRDWCGAELSLTRSVSNRLVVSVNTCFPGGSCRKGNFTNRVLACFCLTAAKGFLTSRQSKISVSESWVAR